MSNFDLPLITADARPDFTDARSCQDWLQALPLINVAPTHGRLLGELEELNCFEMPASERLKILELMLEPIRFVQNEHARKFANRTVPLAKPEREILSNIIALWTALGHGYLRCMQALTGVERALLAGSGQLALVAQRALWCTMQKMGERYKCYQQPAPNEWELLHHIYAVAEERSIVDVQVDHPIHKDKRKATCMETYLQALLIDIANPNEQTSRQLAFTARWLDRFAFKARVLPIQAPPNDKPDDKSMRPICVRLDGSTGPSRAEAALPPDTQTLRQIDVTELGRSLRKRLSALKEGEQPANLGLGDDVPVQFAENFLTLLHRLWCEDRAPRTPARKSASANALLATGMGAIHFFLSGLPFKQPGEAKELTKAQHEEIATFGRIATRQDDEYARLQGFKLESWRILDESIAGFRLQRDDGAGRFMHGQLVAICPADSKHFILSAVRWLAADGDFNPEIGVRAIPGIPQCIAVRSTGLNAMAEKYIPALMLPEVAALRSPASLMLPVGWFKPKRAIDVYLDRPQTMLLTGVLERGSDYERVSFTPV